MTGHTEPLLPVANTSSQPPQQDLDRLIKTNRDALKQKHVMAILYLVYAALDHASAAICHPDHTIKNGIEFAKKKSRQDWIDEAQLVMGKVWDWAKTNRVKVSLMVVGLGFSAFKAKTMGRRMLDFASSYCEWSRSKPLPVRLGGFLLLMSVRLIVSTLVPPTSPGFGIIVQAATPDNEKWTAMPCFVIASAVAGAWPWILDNIIQVFTKEDFWFTMGAKRFADNFPLTCWTGPAMRCAFQRVYRDEGSEERRLENGKLAASFAVIIGHLVPFMGAQTTIMQRFFLPHPLDTIVSQPFGMTEDLVSMAMAEAMTNPVLASWSLTALIVTFNLARGLIFSGRHQEDNIKTPSSFHLLEQHSFHSEGTDWVALASAVINVLVGVALGFIVGGELAIKAACCVVAVQMLVQLFLVPIVLGQFWTTVLFVRRLQVVRRPCWTTVLLIWQRALNLFNL